MRQWIIDKLRSYFGREREERERSLAPSQAAERRLPGLRTYPTFVSCGFCERKILLEIALCGVSHNIGFAVSCHGCLKKHGIKKEYADEYPEEAAQIQKWLDEN